MKYISATVWRDLTDRHLYAEGDEFPFDGREVPAERLDELAGSGNRAGFPLIRAVDVQDEPEEVRKEAEPEEAAEARKTAPRKAPAKKPAAKKTTKK